VSELHRNVLNDPAWFERLVLTLSITVSAMFRDPAFYRAFRAEVVPLLRTYPYVRIWHAGCSTGEEVYSLAMLLEEEGLYQRCRIYATDMNGAALTRAKAGVFPLRVMQQYTENYVNAGGTGFFSNYYTASHDQVVFRAGLRKHITFAEHNLVTDGSFNEFNVILCRNVMIYFNKTLQDRVHHLLYESLGMFGILGLGDKESLRLTPHESQYADLDLKVRLYRKVA
jgi:chemotaxis protein methyltransferase CheR